MSNKNKPKKSYDNLLLNIIQALILIGLTWTGSTINSLNEDVAVLNVKLDNLEVSVGNGMLDRYTGSDAIKDSQLMNLKIADLTRRLELVEVKIP